MPLIPFGKVLSCSSEDRVHRAENLLRPEKYKKWLSSSGNDEQISCVLELEKPSTISSVDIGNDGSAFIELFVSNSASTKPDDWTLLLPITLLMTPNESASNMNRNHVLLLKSTDLNPKALNEKWDRLKIVCEQKFCRLNQFGLCFIKLSSSETLKDETNQSPSFNRSTVKHQLDFDDDDDEAEKAQSKIGSFFAQKQAEKKFKTDEPNNPNAEIRALSNVADQLLSTKPMNDDEIQVLLKKKVQKPAQHSTKRRLSDEFESKKEPNESKRKPVEKGKLMKNVVFVLSGFQNPLRSELRNKATAMGATYSDDWDENCTHLICAFANTPKFTQVQKTGKGTIVNKQWILDCHEQSKLLSENDYQLTGSKKNETPSRKSTKSLKYDDDEDEPKKETLKSKSSSTVPKDDESNKKTPTKIIETFDDDEDEVPSPKMTRRSSRIKKDIQTFDDEDDDGESTGESNSSPEKTTKAQWNPQIYDAETDEDEPKTFKLDNFFSGKHFYVFNDEFNTATLHDIRRIIYAYDGILEKQMTDHVKYIITNRIWTEAFDKIAKTHPDLKFLSLEWLQDCHNENKMVPCQPYLIVP